MLVIFVYYIIDFKFIPTNVIVNEPLTVKVGVKSAYCVMISPIHTNSLQFGAAKTISLAVSY